MCSEVNAKVFELDKLGLALRPSLLKRDVLALSFCSLRGAIRTGSFFLQLVYILILLVSDNLLAIFLHDFPSAVMLCTECSQIKLLYNAEPGERETVRSFSRLRELISRAKLGCQFCNMVKMALTDVEAATTSSQRKRLARLAAHVSGDLDIEISIQCRFASYLMDMDILCKEGNQTNTYNLGGVFAKKGMRPCLAGHWNLLNI